ncbi:hypothetical protein LJK88_29350 [Paenibacillus sp. P26]|nr:hypothetical protein LJK88_29350 [Paenibacillus sp. P26]UUZ94594.1 hypothetical protein LJK87_08705 [Paenibacillus sp. P25]
MKFLLFTWRFPDRGSERIEKALSEFAQGKHILILRSDREAANFLHTLTDPATGEPPEGGNR